MNLVRPKPTTTVTTCRSSKTLEPFGGTYSDQPSLMRASVSLVSSGPNERRRTRPVVRPGISQMEKRKRTRARSVSVLIGPYCIKLKWLHANGGLTRLKYVCDRTGPGLMRLTRFIMRWWWWSELGRFSVPTYHMIQYLR